MSMQPVGNSALSPSNYSTESKIGSGSTPTTNKNPAAGMLRSGKEIKMLESQGLSLSIGEEQLVKAIDRAIKALEGPSTMFEMKVHEQTNAVIIKVINKDTGEVIREIPPEKTLDLVVKMMEFAGILIDEKV